ncbi:MAG TPA: hypothetical protein ENF80_00435, partial [Thermofilum sp.]|nr:hypothetical protein [Thermofilum sp.]
MKEVRIRRKGYLTEEEFRKYLLLVRSIANYDPSSKEWVVSKDKLLKLSPMEVKHIVNELTSYAHIDVSEVLSLLTQGTTVSTEVYLGSDRVLRFKDLRSRQLVTALAKDK